MTNVNIEFPNDIHKKAKVEAAKSNLTLKQFIIKATEEKIKKVKK